MFNKKGNKIWTVIGIIIFIVLIYVLSRHSGVIMKILHKSGPWAPIIALILYPALAPTPITTDPITLLLSVTYNPLLASIIAIAGNMASAIVEYFIGGRIGKAANFEKTKEKIPFGLGKMPVNSTAFLIFGRMIPGYGSKIISFLAGIYKVEMKRYLWTTLITTVLGSVLLAYGGFGLIHIIKNIVRVFTGGV